METMFSFLPEEEQHRAVREVTLNVFDLFGEGDEEVVPVLSPLGQEDREGRQDAGPNLVEQYLETTSQVDCASASVPLKRTTRMVRKKQTNSCSRKGMWIAKHSCVCHGRTGQFRYPDDCHSFVDCWRGRGTLKKCHPRSLVFNEKTVSRLCTSI